MISVMSVFYFLIRIIVLALVLGGLGFGFYYLFMKKKPSLSSKILEETNLLMTVLPRAMAEEHWSNCTHSNRAINRLNIAAMYLIICLNTIKNTRYNANYLNSKSYEQLLQEVLPSLKKLYNQRGIEAKRMNELIHLNFKKIKLVVTNFYKEFQAKDTDPTTLVQLWFEELSHINLSNKSYLTEILLTIFAADGNVKNEQFIKSLCQVKPHHYLLNQVRDETESFIRITKMARAKMDLSQPDDEIISHGYFEQYSMALLLVFAIMNIKQAGSNMNYLRKYEYLLLKPKLVSMIRNMLLTSRRMGVNSLTDEQVKHIISLVEKQLLLLENACIEYFNALSTNSFKAVNFLFNWYKHSSDANQYASTLVRDYIISELGLNHSVMIKSESHQLISSR